MSDRAETMVVERFAKEVFGAIDIDGHVVPMPIAPADWHEHPLAHKARWVGGAQDAEIVRAALVLLRDLRNQS